MSDFPPPGEQPSSAPPPPAPPAPGWWQASDGNWYPPESMPGHAPPPGMPAPANYGPPPAYGGAGYGYTVGSGSSSTNGFAVASLVLGIVWIYWIGSVLALVFGYIALGQIKQQHQQGKGLAIAGIVLGWVGVAFFALGLIVLAADA